MINVTAGGVCLPEFDQCIALWASVIVQHTARNNDAFTKWVAILGAVTREIRIQFADDLVAVDGAGDF